VEALGTVKDFYQHAGSLVEVITVPEGGTTDHGIKRSAGTPRIHRTQRVRMQAILSKVLDPYEPKTNPKGDVTKKDKAPPLSLADGILQKGQWDTVPVLAGMVTSPIFLKDGSLLTEFGYHPGSGLYLVDTGLGALSIPKKPTRADARRAVAKVLELVTDVPWETPVDRSAWLASLLTLFCRHALQGAAVPMFALDANSKGVAKTLCQARLQGILFQGSPFPTMSVPPNDEEMDKRLMSMALAGDTCICIDNVDGEFRKFPRLDDAITSGNLRSRQLGSNTADASIIVPIHAVFQINGINLSFPGEDGSTVRRIVRARIVTDLDHPELRDPAKFKFPHLESHSKKHRDEYVGALLTLFRAYHLAGRPKQKMMPMGSFEEWGALVRGVLLWLGQPDPCANYVAFSETADAGRNFLGMLLTALSTPRPAFPGDKDSEEMALLDEKALGYGLTASGLHSRSECQSLLPPPRATKALCKKVDDYNEALEGLATVIAALGGEGIKFSSERLGKALGKLKDRPLGGLRLVRSKERTGVFVRAVPIKKGGKLHFSEGGNKFPRCKVQQKRGC
jgi:hypothetical protein